MSKRFQNELPYEYENSFEKSDKINLLTRSPTSKYDLHKNSYNFHYFSKEAEYDQTQQNHQYRLHHREHSHNHRDHNHYHQNSKNINFEDDYDRHSISPLSAYPSFVYKRNCNSNNNNYNTNVKNNGNRFNEEFRQSLPATEYLQLQHSNQINVNTVSEEHYHHYYSHFYYQNSPSPKVSKRLGSGRKLPLTSKMPFPKKNINSVESQLIPECDLIYAEENILRVDNNDNTQNGCRTNYINYILKEKSTNNNDLGNDHDNWKYEANDIEQLKCVGSDYYDEKSLETLQYNTFCEVPKSTARRKTQFEDEANINKTEIITDNEEHFNRNIKLPATPIKTKGITMKKLSPPPKNRRVLIYDIQSPRLSRLSTTNIKLQRTKLKIHNDAKIENGSKYFDVSLSENKANENQVQVLSSMIPVRDLNKIECVESTPKDFNTTDVLKECDNSDDDDFDDVSDFESSTDSDISSDSEEGYRTYAFKLTHLLDTVSTTPSVESSMFTESDCLDNPDALLVPSLFPNVPPYLAFSSNTRKGPEVPVDLYRILKWRVTNVMPRVVRTILANSGMRLLKKTNDWMGVWGKHMKSPCFKTIRPYQKINHLPGSFKIGRKDSCWKNLVKLMAKHGKKDFGFMPKTYIIPNDLKQLRKNWPKYAQKNVKWIIKPPASARGTGIRVVDRWAQIPKRKPFIVQKYIEKPLLINGSKFDLRLYVLVTSINPLRVYMYHNGLARFASVKYSDKSDTLNDRCMHLTNYSINKFSSNYSKNEDVNACHGHKWTIKSLWSYLGGRGVKTELLWAALRSLVLRTILAGENSINNMIRANVESKYSCFELFGFDVLLDADLVPWLLEVNISPSLHSELPLDSHVKAPLVQSVLNTALYNIPPKIPLDRQREIATEMSLPPGPICYDKRMYINYLSRTEKIKHNTFTRKIMDDRDEYIDAILDHLTPDDVRCLIIAEDELARCSPLERIFPTIETYKYLKYTEAPRYYNRLLDAWETRYANNRTEGIHLLRQFCEDGYHLQIPQVPAKKPLKYRTRAIMQKRHYRSALTIASFNNKWKEGQRLKPIINSINHITSVNRLHLINNLSEGEETEKEA